MAPGGYPGGYGQGGGRRRQQKSKTGAIVAAVLAVVLVAGGGIWFATSGGDGGEGGDSASDPAEAKVTGKVPMPAVDDEAITMGMWTTDKNFVKAGVNEIVGYPLAGGKAEWKVPLGGNLCWSSSHATKEGQVAVLFEKGEDSDPECTQVGLVDVRQGKLLWQKQAIDEFDDTMDFDEVTIGGGTVAAGGTGGGAAWSAEGKELWKPGEDDECDDNGYAGSDEKLVVIRECGDSDPPALRVQTLDPATGEAKSTYKIPSGPEYVHVASVDPLLVGYDADDAEPGANVADFITLDDSGAQAKQVSKIDILADAYELSCPATSVSGCTEFAVNKETGTLYLGSDQSPRGQYDIGNKLVAFDLKTGKKTGQTKMKEGVVLVPMGLDEKGSVLAYQEPKVSEAGGVWEVDAKSFGLKQLMRHPADDAKLEGTFSTDRRLLYSQKRLYLGDEKAHRQSADVPAGRPLAMVFGSGG